MLFKKKSKSLSSRDAHMLIINEIDNFYCEIEQQRCISEKRGKAAKTTAEKIGWNIIAADIFTVEDRLDDLKRFIDYVFEEL